MIGWYQRTRHGKAYVPGMIWGTLQTEAYATVILRRVSGAASHGDAARGLISKALAFWSEG
ncbi:hypothetical protein [Streptomyces sp. WELS2]|uniref:hypothetical protein n=1 Tax=Streptomyces sp. WELS2 TaxID=2749435 RepID=UPI00215DB06D|nr:hypothetical protein [Streptomyces sp. WELS2]